MGIVRCAGCMRNPVSSKAFFDLIEADGNFPAFGLDSLLSRFSS